MKITKSQLKQIIKEELNEVEIGGQRTVVHLNQLIQDNPQGVGLNGIASYLINNLYRANFDENREGLVAILREHIPQLENISKALTTAKKEYVATLNEIDVEWSKTLESINNKVDAAGEARRPAPGMGTEKAQLRDRMRKAYANRENNPEEYEAARKAYRELTRKQ